jgi:AcrR family transcriptional regulator
MNQYSQKPPPVIRGMSQEQPETTLRWTLPVKQTRAGRTRDRLLAAGFKLLRRKHFEELSVADIARAAGCAVGSFYLRFADKDQYFLAIAETRRVQSRAQLETCYEGATLENIVTRAVGRDLEFVLEHPNLWRAALRKGTTDPGFWQEFRELGRLSVDRFVECYARLLGRPLGNDEVEHVRFGFQVLRGTLNNTLMNQPGPLKLEDPAFRRQIERAFRLVAGIESADERPAKRGVRKRAEPRS